MNRNSSCANKYNRKYISPFERLFRRNRAWKRATVQRREEDLQQRCEEGKLTPFEQPSHSLYFINQTTEIFIIDDLIDKAKLVHHYSIDTEGDPLTHKPATIQVEFIQQHATPVIIIIESQYLPPMDSPSFKKIQNLCSIIFSNNNKVYSWGPAHEELRKFTPYNLFINDIIIDEQDLQEQYDPITKYGLQNMIKDAFKQYLDKTYTLAEWACGLDLNLGQHIPEGVHGGAFAIQVNEETRYRQELTKYAINDVFAVTKLAIIHDKQIYLTPPSTVEQEQIDDTRPMELEQEQTIELQPLGDELIINVQEEEINDMMNYENEQNNQQISIENELYNFNNILEHYQANPGRQYEEIHPDQQMEVHVVDGPTAEVQFNINSNEPRVHVRYYQGQSFNMDNPQEAEEFRIFRNRIKNRKHRINRYRHEVIRQCYEEFNTTQVKQILKSMNIKTVNVNMVRHTLYIGLKNRQMVDEVEEKLNDGIFTQQHYYQLYQRWKIIIQLVQ